jgi:hypothetical protein
MNHRTNRNSQWIKKNDFFNKTELIEGLMGMKDKNY